MDASVLIAILSALVAAGGLCVAYTEYARVRVRDQIDSVRYFLEAYRELTRGCGDDPAAAIVAKLSPEGYDPGWLFDYWSMLSIEYYFMTKNQLPREIFGVWMGDLAQAYTGTEGEHIWSAHFKFLDANEPSLSRTMDFFARLRREAKEESDVPLRRRVNVLVRDWTIPQAPPAALMWNAKLRQDAD